MKIYHNVYKFNLNTDAEIFYRQCQNIIRNPFKNKKSGILTICGNEVTSPDWMDVVPMPGSLIEKSYIQI
jgi:hypothetical protein